MLGQLCLAINFCNLTPDGCRIPNNFSPNSNETQLFAQIESSTCNFMVPFVYDTSQLPVSLLSFKGQNMEGNNVLKWSTATESNNLGFDIERSLDGKNFERIGTVDGGGTSKDVRSYQYVDRHPFATTYYRLKQIDLDGTFSYSRIITVKGGEFYFTVYPNPSQDQLYIKNIKGGTEVSISDIYGKELIRKIALPAVPFDISSLPSGDFVVTIGTHSQKLVVSR